MKKKATIFLMASALVVSTAAIGAYAWHDKRTGTLSYGQRLTVELKGWSKPFYFYSDQSNVGFRYDFSAIAGEKDFVKWTHLDGWGGRKEMVRYFEANPFRISFKVD